ncbi:WD40-repeat-containing domain protein [Pelagophyceae sp. CCMP2097]|nr:WD40-repeat-containing domain protein [Pelagophyceae sp. CCMP2097]|mmetsp:Transcript_6615/g.21373  ORF Transcript_6615/g.21373 Transcript_6615/m.21373 type:complete len:669 (-) Transcript_6615:151-2157(-)
MKRGVKKASGGPKKTSKEEKRDAPIPVHDDDEMYQEPYRLIKKPANQLDLKEEELKEEFMKILTTNDPNVPSNITKFSYHSRKFKQDPPGNADHCAFHFTLDGCLVHKETSEAKDQHAYYAKYREDLAEQRKQIIQEHGKDEDAGAGDVFENRKNQFNYSERAAQTFNNPLRERCIATKPPAVMIFRGTVSQWEIYDRYMSDYAMALAEQEALKHQEKKKAGGKDSTASSSAGKEDDTVHSQRMGNALKILERMVNQNADDEIFQDFKYWEDASDCFRDGEGSLLPLWRFHTERAKRKQVTALAWNPKYPDLFAVGFGSYDFMRQGSGMVCCFSLKNTSYPEYTFTTESGVMCLHFHPEHCSLLAVGCYDGVVVVYDVRRKGNRPIYASSIKTGKHTDPVWQVQWQVEDLAKELNFFSISSDGRVANWTMSKNELKMEPVMALKLVAASKDDPEETLLSGLAGGCCFDFNRVAEHLFIVGTEEGKIHKCSKAYSGQYLETYVGHHMAVYTIRWNPFHPRVFISCSADWTVKLWDHNSCNAVMSFDLGNAVGDVAWSPYSATVFAAVTSDGKVHVFDLAENKHEPLCEQKVVKRAKLTHVSFNQRDPILIVGDDRGGVNSLKLSPNLRLLHDTPENDQAPPSNPEEAAQRQVDNMDKLLASVDTKPAAA